MIMWNLIQEGQVYFDKLAASSRKAGYLKQL